MSEAYVKPGEWSPELLDSPAIIVDETTEFRIGLLNPVQLQAIADDDGFINPEYNDYLDLLLDDNSKYTIEKDDRYRRTQNILVGREHSFGALLPRVIQTPAYLKDYLSDQTSNSQRLGIFRQNEYKNFIYSPRYLPSGQIDYISGVVEEIFDGRNDLNKIDQDYLLSTNNNMIQTINALFINKPGDGGGVSSLRHIFKGDKNGGLHVPAFAEELLGLRDDPEHDIWAPFTAVVSINGASRLRIAEEEGSRRLLPVFSSMFPIGMDSISVLQSVIEAWSHRYDSGDFLVGEKNNSRIFELPFNTGANVDGSYIRIFTDSTSDRIRTAFPVVD